MSLSLIVTLIIFAIILFIATTIVLQKDFIPAKYSLLWYFIAIIIFCVAIFSGAVGFIAHLAGFKTIANLVIGIILALLTFLTMALTIISSHQRKKTTLLIQELSLLKNQINEKSHNNQKTKTTLSNIN